MQTMFNAPGAGSQPAADLIKDSSDAHLHGRRHGSVAHRPGHRRFLGALVRAVQAARAAAGKDRPAAKGAVRMVKIDIDKNPQIAGQLRIQSIPAVFAFFQGRPVDGFAGAQPEIPDQAVR